MAPEATENGRSPAGAPATIPGMRSWRDKKLVLRFANKLQDPGVVPNPNHLISGPWTVEKVLGAIPESRPAEGSDSPIAYFHILERLKTMKREGWRRFGIER